MIVKNILNMKLILQVALLMLLAVIPATSVLADEHITYVHFDALGSSIAGSDSAGNLIWSEDYQPYGDRIVSDNSTGNNLWYTGKASYENFGLSYFGARWYNPILGRFTGIDPVRYQEDNIHSFNRYAYANNNPYKFVDPDGRIPVIIIPIIAFIAKELAGEVVEQTTGVQLPTFKNIGKAVFKAGVKKGVAKGAKKISTDPPIQQVDPRNLIPTQTRNEISGSAVKRLKKDMQKNGFDQSQPVDAVRNSRGRLEIEDGHHRTEAARKAGLDKIPVRVWGE